MHFIVEILVIASIFYIIRKYELRLEKQEALENRVKWVEFRAELLTQFVCESSTLREDTKKFMARGFNCGHDLFSNDYKNCICEGLKGRVNSLVDRNDFHALLEEKNPTDYMDGSYLYQEKQDKKHARENQQTIFPYLKKLNQIAPESVTDEHLKWLMRDGLHDLHIARFLGWLLPSLHDGFYAIKDPEGKKTLVELETRLGGEIGPLSGAVMLFLKPPPEK